MHTRRAVKCAAYFFRSVIESPGDLIKVDIADDLE